MNWLDWVLIGLLAISVISGLKEGLVKTVFGIAGMIVGVILASRYYTILAPYLQFVQQENLSKILAFIIITAVVIVIAGILGTIFRKLISMIMLGWLDRLLGAVLSLALCVLSLGVGLALLTKFSFLGLDQIITQSKIASILLKSYPLIKGLLPSDFSDLGNLF